VGERTGCFLRVDEVLVFSPQQVNFFVLRKQHLLDDPGGASGDIMRIAGDIGGLHATSAATPYLSLFARMRDFKREQLDEELYNRKSLGKVRGVRGTVYIYPREMLPVAHAANRRMNIPNSQRFYRYMDRTEDEYDYLSHRIMKLLRGRGMTAAEIKRELGEEKSVSPVVNLMCDFGLLIRGAPAGGWRSNEHTYHVLEDYMPGVDLAALDEESARESVVQSYLAAFGPASEGDIAWWTAFLKGDVRAILKKSGVAVSRIGIAGMDRDYFMLASELQALKSSVKPKQPTVNLLPYLDPYLMAYKQRERYLSPDHLRFVIDRGGNAANCIMLDGIIAGVWDYSDKPPTFRYFPFEKASRLSHQAIRKQALRLGKFLAGVEVELEECGNMTPLAERTAGAFMAPLKDACPL
jgi:DNA glycosylase AlkZ-like